MKLLLLQHPTCGRCCLQVHSSFLFWSGLNQLGATGSFSSKDAGLGSIQVAENDSDRIFRFESVLQSSIIIFNCNRTNMTQDKTKTTQHERRPQKCQTWRVCHQSFSLDGACGRNKVTHEYHLARTTFRWNWENGDVTRLDPGYFKSFHETMCDAAEPFKVYSRDEFSKSSRRTGSTGSLPFHQGYSVRY